MTCEACNDRGYLCMSVTSRSEGSLCEIQRCDACCKYRSDFDAIAAVYDKAVMYDNLEKTGEYASRRVVKLEDAVKKAVEVLDRLRVRLDQIETLEQDSDEYLGTAMHMAEWARFDLEKALE